MSLSQKLIAINIATKDMSVPDLAKEFGLSRQHMHARIAKPNFILQFLEYVEFFGFELVAENEQGTIIPLTLKDAQEDFDARKQKRDNWGKKE